jgi:hypothetical protein
LRFKVETANSNIRVVRRLLLVFSIIVYFILITLHGSVDESGIEEQLQEAVISSEACSYYELISCYMIEVVSGLDYAEKIVQILYMLFSSIFFYIFFRSYDIASYLVFLMTFAFLYCFTQVEWGAALSLIMVGYSLASGRIKKLVTGVISSMIHLGVAPLALVMLLNKRSTRPLPISYVIAISVLLLVVTIIFQEVLLSYMYLGFQSKLGHYSELRSTDPTLMLTLAVFGVLFFLFSVYYKKEDGFDFYKLRGLTSIAALNISGALVFLKLNLPVPMYRYLEVAMFLSVIGLIDLKYSANFFRYFSGLSFITLFWGIYGSRLF